MFTILRYSQQRDEPIRIENQCLATPWNSGGRPQHTACESCRAKKMRCSGQRTGCDRCKAKSAKCVYITGNEYTGSSPKAGQHNASSRESFRSSSSTAAEVDRMTSVSADPLHGSQGGNISNYQAHPCPDRSTTVADETFSQEFENWVNGELEPDPVCSVGDASEMTLSETTNTNADFAVHSSFLSAETTRPDRDLARFSSCREQEQRMDWDRNLTNGGGSVQQFASGYMQPVIPTDMHDSSGTFVDHTPPPSRGESTQSDPSMPLYAFSRVSSQNAMQCKPTCQCLPDVTRVLEMLEANSTSSAQSKLPSIDSILAIQKRAVEKCTVMLDCGYCQSSPDRVLLIALLGDKLLTEFETILAPLPSQIICLKPQQPSCDPELPLDTCTTTHILKGGGRRLFVGEYEIDSNEWISFVKMLVDLHATRLGEFIVRSKSWATTSIRDIPFTMFLKLEHRFQAVSEALVLRRAGESSQYL